MKSKATASFWASYQRLPHSVRRAATKQFKLWLEDHNHPSVRFKKVGKYWSARVTAGYRAAGILDGDTIIWFFIGTHSEYDRLLSQ